MWATVSDGLLGAADLRALAGRLGIRPTKTLGQNFVVDANTVRRIVRAAELEPGEHVLEVGPGLGSLTLGLLAAGHPVTAVEIDPVLAAELPHTIANRVPERAGLVNVLQHDALRLDELPEPAPTALVANLPYNVATPVLLTLLARFDSLARVLVMVQAEVADRLAAGPGTKTYGAPSAKAAWYGPTSRAGDISRRVFWPVPNVDSALVRLRRNPVPPGRQDERARTFAVIDAAFAQRRKTLRAALAGWAGSPSRAEALLREAGIDPSARGETLGIEDFLAIARAAEGTDGVPGRDPDLGC